MHGDKPDTEIQRAPEGTGKETPKARSDSRNCLAHASFVIPPGLQSRLEWWGLVVGYRAGVLARPKFSRSALRLGLRSVEGHRGLSPSQWELTKDWRQTTKVNDWPSREDAARGAGAKGDARMVQVAYWDLAAAIDGRRTIQQAAGIWPDGVPQVLERPKMRRLASGDVVVDLQGKANRTVEMLLTWLYAVPHYTGDATTIESFASERHPHLESSALARRAERYRGELDDWMLRACKLMAIHAPQDVLSLDSLLPEELHRHDSAIRVCPRCYDQILGTLRQRYSLPIVRRSSALYGDPDGPVRQWEGLGVNVVYDRGALLLIRAKGGFCVCR